MAEAEVLDEQEEGSDVSFDIEEGEEPSDKETSTDDEKPKESDDLSDEDEDEDFEAILLDDSYSEEEEDGDEEDEVDNSSPTVSNELTQALQRLKEISEQLEAVPEAQDANFQRLRKMNRELTKMKIAELEGIPDLSVFGDADKVKEAVEAYDGLFGYDVKRGTISSEKFTDWLLEKDSRLAYDTTLRLLMGKTDDGRTLMDLVTYNVLGIDPSRLEDFQAISKGEIPEGYEGMLTSNEDLEAVPVEYRNAFKTLTPKLKQIVLDGFDTYASKSDQAEAMKVLTSASEQLRFEETRKQEEIRQQEALAQQEVATFQEIGNDAVESIASTMDKALKRVVFSENEVLNDVMRNSIVQSLFALKNESNYIRQQAVEGLAQWGATLNAEQQKQLDHWYDRLAEAVQTETSAKVNGHDDVYRRARQNRREAQTRLAVLGLKMGAEIAKKLGAKRSGGIKPPVNQTPSIEGGGGEEESPSKRRSPAEYARATQQGRVLR